MLIAGKFAGPTSTQENLVLVDGATGKVEQWYNSPPLKSVLVAPDLGRVYGGGSALGVRLRHGQGALDPGQDRTWTPFAPTTASRPTAT